MWAGPGDRDVALVGAPGVEHSRVDRAPDRHGDIGGAQPLQRLFGVPSHHEVLGERRLVEHRDGLTSGALLGDRPLHPGRTFPGVLDDGRNSLRGKDIGAFPVVATAQAGTLSDQVLMDRRAPQRAGRLQLTVGPRQGVVQPQHLAHPGTQPVGVARERREAAQVRADEVHGRTTLDDPFGHRAARPARGRDAHGVEAGADEEARHRGRLADDELVVGREALRTVVELADSGFGENGDPVHGTGHQDLEVLPVLLEEGELERVRNLVRSNPWLGHRLETPHQQATHLFLDVRVAVGVAQDGQVAVDALDLVGHDVEVLGRVQRHRDPDEVTDGLGPLPGAVDHDLALDVSVVGPNPARPFPRGEDVGDPDSLEDPHPPHPRALGQGLGEVCGVGASVARQPDGAHDVVDLDEGVPLARLARGQQLALEVVCRRARGSAA